jgi:DNA invertase Pin-like site-specific DNA recombinase
MTSERQRQGAAYVRSAAPDAEHIAAQVKSCRAVAATLGYEIPDELVFSDDGASGLAVARPALTRLLRVVESGQASFDRLFVRDHKRLGRWSDPRMYSLFRARFEGHGVTISYASAPGTPQLADVGQDVGVDLVSVMEALRTTFEPERLKRRTRRSRKTDNDVGS